MNKDLMIIEGRILSTDLVDIINEFRKLEESKAVLTHDNFIKKIRKEVEKLETLGLYSEPNFEVSSYLDKNNQERPCYSLNRDGMLQMLNSESTLVRYKTVEYINRLEEEIKNKNQITGENIKLTTHYLTKDLPILFKDYYSVENNIDILLERIKELDVDAKKKKSYISLIQLNIKKMLDNEKDIANAYKLQKAIISFDKYYKKVCNSKTAANSKKINKLLYENKELKDSLKNKPINITKCSKKKLLEIYDKNGAIQEIISNKIEFKEFSAFDKDINDGVRKIARITQTSVQAVWQELYDVFRKNFALNPYNASLIGFKTYIEYIWHEGYDYQLRNVLVALSKKYKVSL